MHGIGLDLDVREWFDYSHSIVSGTYKQLKIRHFLSEHAELTVRSTAKTFRLTAIEGD
jgi:hypothetical protein